METNTFGVLSICFFLLSGCIGDSEAQGGGLKDVTAWTGEIAVLECPNSFSGYSWWVYNPRPTLIYPNPPPNIDQTKYSVDNTTFALSVKNVQTTDGVTYCCGYSLFNCQFGNLLVIDDLEASVASVGDQVNLTCFLRYGSPNTDTLTVNPLSDDQDPKLTMFIDNENITSSGQLIVGDGIPHTKTLSFNRTARKSDINAELICNVRSLDMENSTSVPMDILVESPQENRPNSSDTGQRIQGVGVGLGIGLGIANIILSLDSSFSWLC